MLHERLVVAMVLVWMLDGMGLELSRAVRDAIMPRAFAAVGQKEESPERSIRL
jgi:hypothetical protein